jgi:hypothetical protein
MERKVRRLAAGGRRIQTLDPRREGVGTFGGMETAAAARAKRATANSVGAPPGAYAEPSGKCEPLVPGRESCCYMGFRFWLIRSLLRSEAASD